MLGRLLVTLATLVLLLIPAVGQTAAPSPPLMFPLQVGQWEEFNCRDNAPSTPNTWTQRIDVLGQVTQAGKQYFHVRLTNSDPFDGDTSKDRYLRSTATAVYGFDALGEPEKLMFRTGAAGTSWTYTKNGALHRREIVSTNDVITIPYGPSGGTYTAYKYKQYLVANPSNYILEWVVPGLGYVADEDYWLGDASRVPVTRKLALVGTDPLLPLQTGTLLTFNSTNGSQNWHMTIEVLEQVSMGGAGQLYYHCRQNNFYPPTGTPSAYPTEMYIRCTDRAVYFYDSYFGDYCAYRVGNIGDSWYRSGGETDTIVDIVDVTVPYGGPYKAYKICRSLYSPYTPAPAAGSPSDTYEYLVPGVWNVIQESNWDTPPITHVLASITHPYFENFESGRAQGWRSNNASYWKVLPIDSGEGLTKVFRAATPATTKQTSMVSIYGGASWSNFVFQADVKQQKLRAYGYASYIVFRATDNFSADSGGVKADSRGSGYAFGLDDGNTSGSAGPSFCVYKIKNGKFSLLTGPVTNCWIPCGYVNPTTSWNTLKVDAQGNFFRFYINDNLVWTYTDEDPVATSGRIGLLGYTDRFGYTAHCFDNVSVIGQP